ncbi:hypothetical protein Tco_0727919 [Tanacetum coccineum]|uniref:Uncharacterized protein n=1 Tax=Tanacetum coccineum TaxID=301880 RepID=A0ABQ4YMT8_9ASTR
MPKDTTVSSIRLGYSDSPLKLKIVETLVDDKTEVLHNRAILGTITTTWKTGIGTDKAIYTYTTTTLITTTDKHGVPPTKRLFRVAMLDPSQGFMDP